MQIRSLIAGLAGLLASFAAPAQPVQSFFENPAFSQARISPSGRHVAMGVTPKGGHTQLVVLDTETMKANVAISPRDADIARIEWVNDDRLVFSVHNSDVAQGDNLLGPGLYAVQRDGSDYRQLVDRVQPFARERTTASRMLNFFTRFHSATRKRDSDTIFVTQEEFDQNRHWQSTQLLKLDTRTGRSEAVPRPGLTAGWVVDANDVPRVSVVFEGGKGSLMVLDSPADNKWRTLQAFDRYQGDGTVPVGFGPDNTLYVSTRGSKDKRALYRFDLAKGTPDPEPLVELRDFDFLGGLVHGRDGLLGVRYLSDAAGTAWFDPKLKQVQQDIDKLLPGQVNIIDVPVRAEVPHVLVRSFSDANPGTFSLYHTGTGKLTPIGSVMRDVDPRQMAQRDLVRYKARDGLEIPAWLTLPKGGKGRKHSLVVLVHGGPWVRGGDWSWYPDSQFLASRGYAVLEPEFRGSTGYGFRHFRSGFKQWGRAMQDDVADGARWALQQGIAEPGRVCIAGGSYGGYSTLMGLVNDPDLYKCGIAVASVTDIDLMYTVTWSDFSDEYKTYGMPRLVGDREKDAAQLKATSPIEQAGRIKQPLMLVHGGADVRVPIVHSIRFRDAVKQGNLNVEWVEYKEEGHGLVLVKNRVDYWTRVEKFLATHIGR
jgi:dipeptidyl aminopeptidase/acylaminoacyl peptidase